MAYNIRIGENAIQDIEEINLWYESRQYDLGNKFISSLFENIEYLRSNPFFQVRYSNVRCLPLNTFPYMIHFTVDEDTKTVNIRAVLNTSLDPKKWRIRK